MAARVSGWIRWALLDEAHRRPRVGVRLVLHTVGVLLSYVAGAGVVWLLGGAAWSRAAAVALQTALVVLVTWAATRLDRRPFLDLVGALDARAALDVGAGVLLGGLLVLGIAAVELGGSLAGYRAVPLAPAGLLRASASILFFVSVAIDEELWFRGYQLTNLAEALEGRLGRDRARGLALGLSAIVFGLAHALNPGASVISTVNIAFGGVLLGASFAITGRLGLALGLHFAWNTAQAWLDMPVSGQVLLDDLFVHREEHGDDVVTGGAFGPEGGLVGLSFMFVGILASVAYARTGRREGDVRSAEDVSP